MSVDDPRSAVETAAGLVDDSSQAVVAFVKEKQDSLRAAWRGEDARTEELRVALQRYRAFGTPSRRFLPRNLSAQTHVRTAVLMADPVEIYGIENPAGRPRASRARQDARVCARDLRLTLAREHLGRPAATTRSRCFYDPDGFPPALRRSSAF